jgi:hypothetical protein
MGIGIDLTPQGLRSPGVLQDYTVLRAQPWAPPLIARTTHVRFWVDWPFVQPDAAIALEDRANPDCRTCSRSTLRSTPSWPTGCT